MAKISAIHNIDLLSKIIETQSILATTNLNLQDFMQSLANNIHTFVPATGTVIELVEGAFMVYKAVSGTVANYQNLKLPFKGSISGRCVLENKVLISKDTEKDPRVNLEACRRVLARSMVVAPLLYSGKPVGVIKILSKYPDAFNSLHVTILEIMAGFITSALKHQILFEEKEKAIKKLKKTQKRLSEITKHDYLTKLPNRKFFDSILNNAMKKVHRKQKELICLMFLDVDNFKHINDHFGHAMGDKLLVRFSEFLLKNVRENDFVVRFGGDEFVILFEDLKQENDAIKIAKKIISKIQKLKFFNRLHVTTSIGITFYHGGKTTPKELIKQADEALYRVKSEGRNSFSVFDKLC